MTIYLCGDSTMADNGSEKAPQQGWGHSLRQLLRCPVENRAHNGRSSKSFLAQGRLSEIEMVIKPGDLLLIQFGHNDCKLEDPLRGTSAGELFPAYLHVYVQTARAHGATSVLLTGVCQRMFDPEGRVLLPLHEYAEATRAVAAETHTPLVDMTLQTAAWLTSVGEAGSAPFYMPDNTHLTEKGALVVAQIAARELVRLRLLDEAN